MILGILYIVQRLGIDIAYYTGMKCKLCGQDHHKAFKCAGAILGKQKKDPEIMRQNAMKRWHPDGVQKAAVK